jgi:hypothetical protein
MGVAAKPREGAKSAPGGEKSIVSRNEKRCGRARPSGPARHHRKAAVGVTVTNVPDSAKREGHTAYSGLTRLSTEATHKMHGHRRETAANLRRNQSLRSIRGKF